MAQESGGIGSSISACSHVTATGSNLTNLTNTRPIPILQEVLIISGSLEVIGDITGSGKINLDNRKWYYH